MEHLANDHEGHPNQHENNHKLCDEAEHPLLCLMESQWKLRQEHDHNFKESKMLTNVRRSRMPGDKNMITTSRSQKC